MSYTGVTGILGEMTNRKELHVCIYHKCKTYCLSSVIVQYKLNVPCMGLPPYFH